MERKELREIDIDILIKSTGIMCKEKLMDTRIKGHWDEYKTWDALDYRRGQEHNELVAELNTLAKILAIGIQGNERAYRQALQRIREEATDLINVLMFEIDRATKELMALEGQACE